MKKHKLYFTDTPPRPDGPDPVPGGSGSRRYFYSPFGATITALLMLIGELLLSLAAAGSIALLLTALVR